MVPLTVKDDAPGAKYLLDVVASTGTGDKLITKSDQVRVIVSGELKEYMVDGPDYIALDGNATYTVTAMDENGNPPVFAMDENEVRILVQPSTVLVTNLDNDDLTLVHKYRHGQVHRLCAAWRRRRRSGPHHRRFRHHASRSRTSPSARLRSR